MDPRALVARGRAIADLVPRRRPLAFGSVPALAAAAVLSTLTPGCTSDGGGAPEEPRDIVEMELFDSTIALDAAALDALSTEDPDLTLHFLPPPDGLSELERGNVLIGGVSKTEPKGLLRLVTGVERTAGELVVHTIQTLPQLAFRKLRVEAKRTIDPDAAHPALGPLASGSANPHATLDEFVFNGDGDPTSTDDQVKLTGKLGAGVAYTFGLSADWSDISGSVKEAIGCAFTFFTSCDPLEVLPEITGGLSFEAGADAEIRLKGSAFLGFEKTVTLPPVDFPRIVLGPLVFLPSLEVRADMEGDASSEFDVGASALAHVQAGLSYSSRHGGSALPPEVTKPTFDVLAATPGLGAHARVRVGPRLSIKLYDLLGPFGTLYAFANLDVDRTKSPCYELTAGIEGDVGISLAIEHGFLKLGLPPFSKGFDVASSVVAKGDCPEAPGGKGGPADLLANPTFEPWAKTYGNTLLHFPFEDAGGEAEWTEVNATIDGRWIVSGSSTEALLKIDGDGTPLWTKTYSLPVAWNDTLSQKEILPGRVAMTKDASMLVAAFPYTLFKADEKGAVLWAERFGFPYHEAMLLITGLVAGPDGGFVVSGNVADDRAATFENMDAFVGRFDANGKPLWVKRLGVPGVGETARALVPYAGGAMLLGSAWEPKGAFWTGFAARMDAEGEIVWARKLGETDGAKAVRTFLLSGFETADGDFVAAGTADVAARATTLVVKLKPDGSLAWSSLEDLEDSYVGVTLTGIAGLPTSGMVATGRFTQKFGSDLWVAGLDSIGHIQWTKRIGRTGESGPMGADPGDHNAPGLAVARDGGFLVAGYTQGLASGTSTEGLVVFEPYLKDGTLALSDDRATVTSAGIARTESVDFRTVAWEPPLADIDPGLESVALSARDLGVPVTQLAP